MGFIPVGSEVFFWRYYRLLMKDAYERIQYIFAKYD
jgi:hypothetical protein